jgi:hypothetical protein
MEIPFRSTEKLILINYKSKSFTHHRIALQFSFESLNKTQLHTWFICNNICFKKYYKIFQFEKSLSQKVWKLLLCMWNYIIWCDEQWTLKQWKMRLIIMENCFNPLLRNMRTFYDFNVVFTFYIYMVWLWVHPLISWMSFFYSLLWYFLFRSILSSNTNYPAFTKNNWLFSINVVLSHN